MVNKIYTLGYEKKKISEYLKILTSSRINVLIDVREKAWSHKTDFCKTKLRLHLQSVGIHYLHLPEAGNPIEIRKTSKTISVCLNRYRRYLEKTEAGVYQLASLIYQLSDEGYSVCLTCFEKDYCLCHRSIILEVLQGKVMKFTIINL